MDVYRAKRKDKLTINPFINNQIFYTMKLYEFLHHAKELKKANNVSAIFYVWFIDETKKAKPSHICTTPVESEIADNLLPCEVRWDIKNAADTNPFFGLEGDDAFTNEDGDFMMVYIDGIAPKLLSLEEKAELKAKEKEEKKAKKEAEREAKRKAREAEREAKKAEKKAKAEADKEVAKLKAQKEPKKSQKAGGGKKPENSPNPTGMGDNTPKGAKARKKAQKRAKKA